VIHIFSAAHTSFVISATPAILIGAGLGKRMILHYHSGEADLHLRRWRRTARRTMRLVDAIVVPSRYLRDQFAHHDLRAILIPNVIEPARFVYRERRALRPVFLCNRQLQPYCNVACVLRAFAIVQAQVSGARLIVAADGVDRPELEALAVRLRLRHTEFIGFVHPDRAAELYSSADIYLNSSDHRDNVPVSILEAFASGLPVCSTDVAGISELVHSGETGMLVAADDHEQLAAVALGLLADPDRASSLAQRARRECSRFVWSEVRESWLTLYQGPAPDPVTG
jgi:glycosyltransferase involved in cell wall biosynthesis